MGDAMKPPKAQAQLLLRIRRGEVLWRGDKAGTYVLWEKNGSGHGVRATTANACRSKGWIADDAVLSGGAIVQMRITDKGDDVLAGMKGVRGWAN